MDRLLTCIDSGLRTSAGVTGRAQRHSPAERVGYTSLAPEKTRMVARLMRVNHAGEVAAQALYEGQALTARDLDLRRAMREAAGDEADHLAWCHQRLDELGSGPSRLSPFWYAGSFTIGAAVGILGDRWSLGFVAETERQVQQHLAGHIDRLPPEDLRSRAVLRQMYDEEGQHGIRAREAGGRALPAPARGLMRLASKVMTTVAYWV
ncbi:MAG: 2-polyprenyl-3-methyl-6-methoxy-1,4-benzoquinone monooxygenase [Gammaproteobacteria bacterium]|nr:2-polyprenyl-3-methyl-6-methoxy-1,4-benzoquinone monooxygenase [Gammaproteobacteria bacterium]